MSERENDRRKRSLYRLQLYKFTSSAYQRPSQKWICGRNENGHPCSLGPDGGGRCNVVAECQPVKQRDRWFCARPAGAGGKCEQGPLPDGRCCRPVSKCSPVRSLRARRALLVQATMLLSIGLVVLFLSGFMRSEMVSPGALTFQHQAATDDCSACHEAGGVKAPALMGAAMHPATDESARCLNCHMLGEDAMSAHSLSSDRLEPVTQRMREQGGAKAGLLLASARQLFGVPGAGDGDIACATCHKEHHGAAHALTQLDNAPCQACHVSTFRNLASGHPEFTDFPYERNTSLIFDHVSHRGKHYPEAEQAFSCAGCHSPDRAGELMLTTNYQQGCAGCHDDQIYGDGRADEQGIPLLRVPGLDLDTLKEAGIDIGAWPEYADGELPPIMQLLLQADADFAAVWPQLEGHDLLDLTDFDPAGLRAVGRYARAVKRLFYDLQQMGQPALQARIESMLGEELDRPTLSALTGLIPADAIESATRAWFPGLAGDLSRAPAWLETAAGPSGRPLLLASLDVAMTGREARRDVPDAVLLAANDILTDDEDILSDDDDILAGDAGDILAADDGKDEIGLLDDDSLEGDILGGDILGGDDILGDELMDLSGGDGGDGAKGEVADAVEAMPPEQRVLVGGWYRQDYDYGFYYRPSGHEDRFIHGWLELVSAVPAGERPVVNKVFRLLADAKGPGLCGKCHSVVDAGQGRLDMQWRARRPMPNHQEFTRFAHVRHFGLMNDRGCFTCHQLDNEADYLAGFEDTDATRFSSNFKPIMRAACTECHSELSEGDQCLTCHNYHIGKTTDMDMYEHSYTPETPRPAPAALMD